MKTSNKRIIKEPHVRRTEIINIARELFEKNGYPNTSIEAIITKAGIAKGTFYYYFKSKNEILKALVENISSEIEMLVTSIVQSNQLTALEKLEQIICSPKKKAITNSSVMDILHKPENRELQEELNIKAVLIIAPLMTQVCEQGYKEGNFKNRISVESIQVFIAGVQFVLDSGLFDWSIDKRVIFLKAIQTDFERLLGVKPGLLKFISNEE